MEQLQILGQTASTETALFHHVAASRNNLHVTDMKALSVLLTERSMTAGEIAERLHLTTGAVTSLIARLMRQNLVKRSRGVPDGRKVIIEVRHEALAKRMDMYESMGASFERMLGAYSTEELTLLVGYFESSIELTKQEIAKLTKK